MLYKRLPELPGVYRFFDADKKILYVGKAKNLRRRVASYFQRTKDLEASKQIMVKAIADIDHTVTGTELEALLLEATFIKQFHPPYNVVLRDDKNFLYIKVTLKDEFPTVVAVRRVTHDGSRYFGPFPSAMTARQSIALLKRLFAFRTCEPHQGKACFDVHLHRCLGPCADRITAEQYRNAVVEPILNFLAGNTSSVIQMLTEQMKAAAAAKEFERAATLRDRLKAVRQVTARQAMISATKEMYDVVGMKRDRDWAAVNVFSVRGGKLMGKKNFLLMQPDSAKDHEILDGFLAQYYPHSPDRPPLVYIGTSPKANADLEKALGMHIKQAQRGTKRRLLQLADTNAAEYLERRKHEWLLEQNRARQAEEELMRALKLPKLPRRIETYDISNNQGKHAVGSMVVFENGKPLNSDYRRFTIRRKQSPDDFAMMAEMLERRLLEHDWPLPDLFLIDGGKGQLSAVFAVFRKLNVSAPLASLAKQEEEIFLPGRSQSIILPRQSPALFLVQRMRDEAHRFAITFYRSKHRKTLRQSVLDDIPGIGPKTRRTLLRKFGSVASLRSADKAAIENLIGPAKAKLVVAALHPKH